MNKFLKRICSIILAIGIVVTAMPSSVFALELSFDKLSFNEFSEQVTTLIEGDSNVFSEAAIGEEEESDKTNRLIVKADKREIDTLGATAYVRGYNDLHILQYSDEKSADSALAYYKKQSYVDYVHEDEFCESVEVAEGSAVTNPMQDVSDLFGYTALNTYLSDNNITFTNEIVVGVVDTGIANDHELLKGRVKPTGFNSVDSSSNCYDDRGHGTHVAGIIAANTLSNVTIKPYKVLNSKGLGTDLQVYLGIMQAVNDDVDIINLSFSRRGESDIMHEAVTAAYNAGVIIVSSAGNKGISLDEVYYSPACFDEVICVASCSDTTYVSDFSNYGTYCDVAAPGENIVSSHLDNTYKSMSGTSMSAPFITAAVAYILSQSPNFTFDDVMARILENVKPCKGRTVGKYLNAEYVTRQKEPSISPEFSYVKTLFSTPFELELSCEDESAEIYYTTSYMIDGQYELYTAPIPVNYDIDVTAYTISEGSKQSYSTTMSYTKTVSASSGFSANADGVLIGYSGDDPNPVVPNRIDGVYVTSVSKDAFSGNEDIQSVSFLSYVNVIEDDAFVGCTNLEYVRAKEVVSIGDRAFQGCTKLLSVNAPKLETLGEYAFENCANLTTMALTTVTRVNASCFSGCSSFMNIGPNSFEYVGENAFKGTNISNVTLNVCTEIGYDAFAECAEMCVFCAPLLTEIQSNIFDGCDKLSCIDLKNVVSLDDMMFEGHTSIGSFYADKIKSLPDNMFKNCESLTDISFAGVETIGEYAFYNTHITDAIFDNAVSVGDYALAEIPELTNVSLKATKEINMFAFEGSVNIESFDFSNAKGFVYDKSVGFEPLDDTFPKIKRFYATMLEIVPEFAFKNCSYDVNFDMRYLKEVGDYAFYGTSFSKLYGDNLIKVGKHAFNKCTGLTQVICPALKSLGEYAFANCPNIKKVEMNLLSELELNAFINSTAVLTEMYINAAETFTFNGGDVRLSENLPAVKKIGIQSLQHIPDNFTYGAKSLALCDIGEIKSVGANGFRGYKGFKTLDIDGLVIGEYAFADNPNLLTLYADNVEEFDFTIVSGCENLNSISLNGITEFNQVFDGENGFNKFPALTVLRLNSLVSIPDNLLANTQVQTLYVNSITEAGNGSLAYSTLRNVYADSLKSVESDTFSQNIATISLGALEHIPAYTFYNRDNLKNVTVPNVETIGDYAFADCGSLQKLYADKATDIGTGIVQNCYSLDYLSLNSLENIDIKEIYGEDFVSGTSSGFDFIEFSANKVKEVPAGFFKNGGYNMVANLEAVETVCEGAFENASVTEINAPNLKKICDKAFYNATLINSLDVDDVTFIGDYCFYNCSKLHFDGSLSKLERLGSYSFKGCKENILGSMHFDNLKIVQEHAFEGIWSDDYISAGEFDGYVPTIKMPNVEEIHSLPMYGTVMIGSVVKTIELDDVNLYEKVDIYTPAQDTVVRDYCNKNNLDYTEFNSENAIIYEDPDNIWQSYTEFNFRGFFKTLQWYGANEYDLSDAVPIPGATDRKLTASGHNSYNYYFCEGISIENGNRVTVRSRRSTTYSEMLFNLRKTGLYLGESFMKERMATDKQGLTPENINERIKLPEGYTCTITPSYECGNTQCYGSGSEIVICFEDRTWYSFPLLVYGDVNGDSYADVLDALACANFIHKPKYSDPNCWMYEITQDRVINVEDYQQIVNETVA